MTEEPKTAEWYTDALAAEKSLRIAYKKLEQKEVIADRKRPFNAGIRVNIPPSKRQEFMDDLFILVSSWEDKYGKDN